MDEDKLIVCIVVYYLENYEHMGKPIMELMEFPVFKVQVFPEGTFEEAR